MPHDFSPDELTALPFVVSKARFSTYLRAEHHDVRAALALYRWNLELSAAFFVPLQVCEIAIRNAAAEAIENVHGSDWPWLEGFRRSLPLRRGYYRQAQDLADTAKRHSTVGQVIAELKFMFWQSMFTSSQDMRIWNSQLPLVFPGMSANLTISEARQKIHDEIEAVRRFRNRIAHHEPIFTRNSVQEYQRLQMITSWRSPVAAAWADRVQRVTEVIARRPRRALNGTEFQCPVTG